MRRSRRYLPHWLAALVAMALVIAGAGCGDNETTSATSPSPTATGVSAQQLIEQSSVKMESVKSFAFDANVDLKMTGDPAKMSDATTAALFSESTKLHAKGSAAMDPEAVDMTVSANVAKQVWDFGVRAKGDKAWIEYKGQWYVVDQEGMTVSPQAQSSADPTKQLRDMGLDPESMGATYELVGTEDVAGHSTYHVTAKVDAQKAIAAMTTAANDPDLATKLGDKDAAAQLKQAYGESSTLLTESERFGDPVLDMWIGVDDMLPYKITAKMTADMTGAEGAEGIETIGLTATVTMNDFDKDVKVVAPTKTKAFDTLMEQVMSGFMTGM